MKKLVLVSVLTAACLAVHVRVARAETGEATAKKSSPPALTKGLWMEFKLGQQIGYAGYMVMMGSSPGFILGYKLGRVVIGGEVGIWWAKSRYDPGGASPAYESEVVTVRVTPLVQVHLLQRGPVALYVSAAAGFGYSWSRYPAGVEQRSNGYTALVDLGFGVRYFLHPRVALGAELGVNGSYTHEVSMADGVRSTGDAWGVGLHGAITVAVVF